jgi:hypothetical protein
MHKQQLILSFLFVQIRSRVWFVVLSFFFKRWIWRLRKVTASMGEELKEDGGQIWRWSALGCCFGCCYWRLNGWGRRFGL